MKKIITISGLLLFAATIYTTSANATTLGPTTGGALVSIANATATTTSPGPALTFSPSPGVSMSASTLINSYALSAANISAAGANRNEFGVWSGYGGYYQQTSVAAGTDGGTAAADVSGYDPSTTATPFVTPWNAMGGAGS